MYPERGGLTLTRQGGAMSDDEIARRLQDEAEAFGRKKQGQQLQGGDVKELQAVSKGNLRGKEIVVVRKSGKKTGEETIKL